MIKDCEFTLHQLNTLILRYGRLDCSSPRRLGIDEMDDLGSIRVKLISHRKSLKHFLDTTPLHGNEEKRGTSEGQLDAILDKVDRVAKRMARRGEGFMSKSYGVEGEEAWKRFRGELVKDGCSSEVLQQNEVRELARHGQRSKSSRNFRECSIVVQTNVACTNCGIQDVLRAYIREIDQKGLLDDVPTKLHAPVRTPGVDSQHWLEEVRTGISPTSSFKSTGVVSDSSAKETVSREDNINYPRLSKMERPKPESRQNGTSRELQNSL